jgi:hypothetical protein
VVHANVDSVAGGGIDKTVALGRITVDIVHVTVGWVGVLVGLVWEVRLFVHGRHTV